MAGHSKWANIRIRKGAQGEAENSRTHLTCVRAAERPATEGGAGVSESRVLAPGDRQGRRKVEQCRSNCRDGRHIPGVCAAKRPRMS
jgi:hypothetical protein